jgi:hypothetical protein
MMNYEKLAEIIAADNEIARRSFEIARATPFPAVLTSPFPSVQDIAVQDSALWQPPLFPPQNEV